MIDQKLIYAVIGASNNKEKYGYKVFKDLIDAKYKAIPINPNEENILEKKCYPTLSEVKRKINVVIFVTQPKITEKTLEEVKSLDIKKVRLQPWSQSNKAIEFCKDNNIECIHDACIMIQRKI